MSANFPPSDRRALGPDGLLKDAGLQSCSPAQFPSSLPAPPRVSTLLPPPPRVGTQNAGVDSRGRDDIGADMHDRATAHSLRSRLMPGNAILPGLVMDDGWLPPRQSQRGMRDRHVDRLSSSRDTRSPHRGHGRRFASDKWRYRRQWHHPDRDRSYPSRRRQHVSDESMRIDDETEEDSSWRSDASSVDQFHEGDTAMPPPTELPSETVSVASDKECVDALSSSAVFHSETVPPS